MAQSTLEVVVVMVQTATGTGNVGNDKLMVRGAALLTADVSL